MEWRLRHAVKNGLPKTVTNLLEGKPGGGTEKGRPRFRIGLGEEGMSVFVHGHSKASKSHPLSSKRQAASSQASRILFRARLKLVFVSSMILNAKRLCADRMQIF